MLQFSVPSVKQSQDSGQLNTSQEDAETTERCIRLLFVCFCLDSVKPQLKMETVVFIFPCALTKRLDAQQLRPVLV